MNEESYLMIFLFGLLSGINPYLKLLALVISYSWNPNEQLGLFYDNKWIVLLTSKGDSGASPTPNMPALHLIIINNYSNQTIVSDIVALLVAI